MFARFRQRSYELEHLDTGDYTSEEYEGCLVELRRVNEWMGDAQALRSSLLKEIEKMDLKSFSVLDVGAGSGELLRVTAKWAHEGQRQARLVGLELNARSTQAIRDESREFPEISAVRADGFKLPFANGQFDYTLCSLFTHHFKDEDVVKLLREMSRVARHGIFAIDLYRHPIAYYFYTTVGRLFLHNRLLREDGALSILRSFKPAELRDLGRRAGLAKVCVKEHSNYRLVLSAQPVISG